MSPLTSKSPSLARDLYAISKPRILYLLLVVAWMAMFLAGGVPDALLFAAVTVAGAASVASSGALNHLLERQRDARMTRTADRPLASGRLAPSTALVYAGIMAVLAYLPLALVGRPLAAVLTVSAIAFYVVVYTVILKPRTPQNIVLGGAAGSFPALIGWTAVTGTLAWPASAPAWILAILVFAWTPAHFWALALLYKDDYKDAGYPMMPNVRGEVSTRRQIIAYTLATIAISFALVPYLGPLYIAAALLLGLRFLTRAVDAHQNPGATADRGLFLFSIQYLGFLLLAGMADRFVASVGWL